MERIINWLLRPWRMKKFWQQVATDRVIDCDALRLQNKELEEDYKAVRLACDSYMNQVCWLENQLENIIDAVRSTQNKLQQVILNTLGLPDEIDDVYSELFQIISNFDKEEK